MSCLSRTGGGRKRAPSVLVQQPELAACGTVAGGVSPRGLTPVPCGEAGAFQPAALAERRASRGTRLWQQQHAALSGLRLPKSGRVFRGLLSVVKRRHFCRVIPIWRTQLWNRVTVIFFPSAIVFASRTGRSAQRPADTCRTATGERAATIRLGYGVLRFLPNEPNGCSYTTSPVTFQHFPQIRVASGSSHYFLP